jgi:N-acetyl-gamma-glutamylphosphate reductase
MSKRLRVAILGGSGYGGAELLRILLFHPQVQIEFVTANEHAGKPVGEVHRNLNGFTSLCFSQLPENLSHLSELACIFLALPHGQAMEIVPKLPRGPKVVDLSGDFRLRDRVLFEQHYGREHTAMDSQSEFVYGLTETNRTAIAKAERIGNP